MKVMRRRVLFFLRAFSGSMLYFQKETLCLPHCPSWNPDGPLWSGPLRPWAICARAPLWARFVVAENRRAIVHKPKIRDTDRACV